MKTKVKRIFLFVIFLVLSIFVWYAFNKYKISHMVLPNDVRHCSSLPKIIDIKSNKVSCYIKQEEVFVLFEEAMQRKECKTPAWGGCFVEEIFYDEKYIQRMEDKYSGSDCNGTLEYRFKGIKKGYTEIVVDGSCHFNKKYKIYIK